MGINTRIKKNIIELTRYSSEEYKKIEKDPVLVVLDNVRSLHNVGAAFRTIDALGLQGIILGGITGCPPHPELRKTALGADKSVEWEHVTDALTECKRLQSLGWKIAVLEQAHGSIPLQDFSPQPGDRIVVVAGNEIAGVNQKIVDMADVILEIPQKGVKHCLNVSVSLGMALWQIVSHKSE